MNAPEAARYDQAIQDITGRWRRRMQRSPAPDALRRNTPIQLQSSPRQPSSRQARRYKTGLGNIVEVAEAQRILTQAEIDDCPG